MALFKIFKGTEVERLTNPSHPNYVPLNSGYCYFDTTTGLFFIDAENNTGELIRAPINANRAIYDIDGEQINNTYLKKNDLIYTIFTKLDGENLSIKYNNSTDSLSISLSKEHLENILGADLVNLLNENKIIKQQYFPDGYPYSEIIQGYIWENKELTFESGENYGDPMTAALADPLGLIIGETYAVTWQGQQYNVVCNQLILEGINIGSYIGRGSYFGLEGSSEPFTIIDIDPAQKDLVGGVAALAMNYDDISSAIISIEGKTEIITKIDEKYLPDNIPQITLNMDTESASMFAGALLSYPIGDIQSKITVISNGREYSVISMQKGLYTSDTPCFVGVFQSALDPVDVPTVEYFMWYESVARAANNNLGYISTNQYPDGDSLENSWFYGQESSRKYKFSFQQLIDSLKTYYYQKNEIDTSLQDLEDTIKNLAPAEHEHNYAGSVSAGGPANSVGHTLNFTVGGIYKGAFNGAEDKFIDVNAVDLNISSALSFLGIVGTAPTSATVTLLDGTVKTAVNGSVVILQSNGVEYFFDGSKWTALGAGESYAIADHAHGNITNEGYLSNSPNRVVITGADGAITAMAAGSNDQVLKMVNGVPAWGTASFTDNKVTNTLATTTKAYITGTTSATTNTGGQVFDTGVYLDMVAGQLTATTFKSNKLIVGTTSAEEHIKFNREGYNYIVAPKNGVIAFSPGSNTAAGATSGAGAKLAVTIESVIPGQNDNAVSLGNPTYKWKNVYSYMFTGDLTGNATSADQLTTIAAGTSTLPVYFSDGIPHPCSTTSPLTVNISGNAGSATKLSKSINISLDGDVLTVDGNSVTTNGANDITITTKLANTYSLDTHTHGHISRNGTIGTSATISTGDSLIIADSSANNIIAKSSITFTAGSKKYLSEGGTWEEIDVKGGVSYGSGSWNQGTSAGPVLNLKDELGNTQLTIPAIPTATSSASGIITTGDQTFAGQKTFNNNIKLNNNLLLTSAKTYGKEFPTTNLTEGQIFFQILPSNEYDVPAGGTQGQILTKITDTDYDCNWTSPKIDGVALSASGSTTHYGVCSTAAATAAKTVDIPGFSLVVGAKITVKFTYANSVASPTLNVSGTGAKPMYRYGTTAMSTGTTTNGWVAGAVQTLVYDGTGWIKEYWNNTTYYNPVVQITTAAATAAKVGSTSAFKLEAGKHFIAWVLYDNTAASALTLNIASTGAKPIYINGTASSSSNYTLPKGQYLVYYNGANYYFYTNGLMLGDKFYADGGTITINKGTSIDADEPAQLIFRTYQTDNSIVTATGKIQFYDDHDAAAYGGNMVISSAGNMIIGAGESPTTCYRTDLVGNTSENMYITSDNSIYFYTNCNTYANAKKTVYINTSGVIMGAGWNDYAEFRETQDFVEAGRVVIENGDDTLSLSTKRLQPGAEIVSDTYGFAIGETERCNTPIAATGRVLAYPYEDKNMFKAGQPVCSGPNGTVSAMTDEEARNYPWCIIGTVSAIPTYDTWGADNIPVNGRIWIRIR